jgi:hypothetical protein
MRYVTNGLGSDIEVFNSSGAAIQTITSGLDLPYGIAFNSTGDASSQTSETTR